jgi:hypothetical protein
VYEGTMNDPQHGSADRHGGAGRRTARRVSLAALAALVVAALGWLLAGLYEDDACSKAQWQCDLGTWGIVAMASGGIVAAVLACAAAVLWLAAWRRGRMR